MGAGSWPADAATTCSAGLIRFRHPLILLASVSRDGDAWKTDKIRRDAVIEEIASILATGYLRLRNARTLQESERHEIPEKTLIVRRIRAFIGL